jgi:spore germination protein KC
MARVKLGVILLLTSAMLLGTGCWNRIELQERDYVLGAAMDRALVEDKVMITVEIANPAQLMAPITGGGGGDTPASRILTSSGWSVFEAVRNFTEQTTNKLFWAHNQVYIIGEDLAREGVAPFLEVFIRDPEPRHNAWVIIAKGTTGREILSIRHVEGVDTARILEEMVLASQSNSNAVMVDLNQFAQKLLLEHRGAVAGRIELIDPGGPEGVLEEGGTNDTGGEAGELLRYSGAAMFKGDRLVGWLGRKQTRGLNWVTGNVVSGIIVSTSPEEGKPKISIEIKEVASNISTRFEVDRPVAKVEVTLDGNLGEHMGARQLSVYPELISQLEARVAEVIRNEIEAALDIAQEHRTDIFNFGTEFNQEHHYQWKEIRENWSDEYFPELLVEIEVEVNIRRQMGSRRPLSEYGQR